MLTRADVEDLKSGGHSRPDKLLYVKAKHLDELCRGYLAWLDVQPRPISDAPKDASRVLMRLKSGYWVFVQWIRTGDDKGFWRSRVTQEASEGWQDDQCLDFITISALSALPTPDKVT